MSPGEASQRRTPLSRIMEDLGGTLLRVVEGPSERPVGGLTIADRSRDLVAGPDGIVLGINVTGEELAMDLLHEMGGAGFAALLLKAPLAEAPSVVEAAAAEGITVIEVSRGVAWGQLYLLLRRLLDPPDDVVSDDGSSDLFQLANELGAVLDAPVTIVDPAVRVLAYSRGQEDTDEARIQTVLGRQVPGTYLQQLIDRGVFDQIAESNDPIYVPFFSEGNLPRTVMPVRVGNRVMGSIWAVSRQPMSEQRLRAFKAAAGIVAIHLLRERAASTAGARLRTEQLAVLLSQNDDPIEPARRLGVLGLPVCVLAVELGGDDDTAERVDELQRISDALSIHLRLVHRAAAVATLGDVAYGLVPVASEEAALRVANEFVERSRSSTTLKAAVGRLVHEAGQIPLSRGDADDVLRLLRHGDRVVASVSSERTNLMVLRLAEVAGVRELPSDGYVAQLMRHDAKHHTDLTPTLAAYLETFGDVRSAAARVHVHPNTFRYRLTRLSAISGIDLDDPDMRLGAMIELRLYHYLDAY